MTIDTIVIHHFGGLATDPRYSTAGFSEKQINAAHQARWPDFPSQLNGSFIGYNVIIYPHGEFKQYRFIGEQTAAAVGSNFNSLHICLAGNFTRGVDTPTKEQVAALRRIIKAALGGTLSSLGLKLLPTARTFSISRIFPHRVVQASTDCYGTALPNDWARQLAMVPESKPVCQIPEDVKKQLTIIQQLFALLLRMQDSLTQYASGLSTLGAAGRSDDGVLTEEILHI